MCQRAGRPNAKVGVAHGTLAYRSPQARVRAEMTAMYDGGVKASQEFEIAATRPRLHHVQAVFDAKLSTKKQQEWAIPRFILRMLKPPGIAEKGEKKLEGETPSTHI